MKLEAIVNKSCQTSETATFIEHGGAMERSDLCDLIVYSRFSAGF